MLVGVEVLSRRAFAAPVKYKKPAYMKKAFEQIFEEMPALPWSIFTDRGTEFDGKEMRDFYAKHDILKFSAENPETKAAMAERMIQTLKGRLYRYFTHKRTYTWTDAVAHVVNGINKSVNRVTGMRPLDFNFQNADKLWRKLYGPGAYATEARPKLVVGDSVRIARDRNVFTKGYMPTFGNFTYKVRAVKDSKPYTYLLKSQNGAPLDKKWYREEVTPATDPGELTIHKVLRQRMNNGEREYLVTWVGEPKESASWITEKDLMLTE